MLIDNFNEYFRVNGLAMEIVRLVNEDNFMAIKLSNEIGVIAEPLNLLGISYFNHIRIFNDLSRLSLANNPQWLEHFFHSKYYCRGRFSKNPFVFDNGHVLWKVAADDHVNIDASKNFNIDNGITIIKSYQYFRDFYLFASTPMNNKINEFYLNNIDLLERFIMYYKDKLPEILKKCKPDKPVYESDPGPLIQKNITKNNISPKVIEKFISLTHAKKIYLYNEKIEYIITPRLRIEILKIL